MDWRELITSVYIIKAVCFWHLVQWQTQNLILLPQAVEDVCYSAAYQMFG